MRPILLLASIVFGIFWGLVPGIWKAKPFWWKLVAVCLITLASFLTLYPFLGASTGEVKALVARGMDKPFDLYIQRTDTSQYVSEGGTAVMLFENAKSLLSKSDATYNNFNKLVFPFNNVPIEFSNNNKVVIQASYNPQNDEFIYINTRAVNPLLVYPYLGALDQRIKNLNFHVPMSWIATIAFLISMIYSIRYLKNRNIDMDIASSSSVAVGLLFTFLAVTTGMVWAEFNWGRFWNWDVRQTTIFVLLLIYSAYFVLRKSIDSQELKARLSAIYSIISFASVPFLMFILPRLTPSLHPGGKDDGTTGPVVDTQSGMLDSDLALTYYLSLSAFLILFFWLFSLLARYRKLKLEMQLRLNN